MNLPTSVEERIKHVRSLPVVCGAVGVNDDDDVITNVIRKPLRLILTKPRQCFLKVLTIFCRDNESHVSIFLRHTSFLRPRDSPGAEFLSNGWRIDLLVTYPKGLKLNA